ncbi:MAG: EAL domain-containing protein [Cocleimonas sp.]|nr:EAL domain-containing protein [Cocleimonas sp.]
MKIINFKNKVNGESGMVSAVTIVALFVFSIILAVWQILYNQGSSLVSGTPVLLPLLQAVLLLLVIVFGVLLYNVRYKSILSQDVMGMTNQGVNLSFSNTENFLGAAAGGIIRLNSSFEVEYINEAALIILGFKDDLRGESVYRLITNYNSKSGHFILKDALEKQFERTVTPSEFSEITLLNVEGEERYLKLKTAPVQNNNGVIDYVILIMQDLTEEKKKMSRLYRQASVDSLTGLKNRHSFQQSLDELLVKPAGGTERHVLCYMDLDHFKVVNDVCGHAAGDELLKQIADIFSKSVRSSDTLARVGGDEFAILLPQCEIETSKRICQRIIEDIHNYRFTWQQNSFSVGVSIGALEFDSKYRVSDRSDLMIRVDQACYKAKQNGRNQLYLEDLNTITAQSNKKTDQHDNWDESINKALKSDQFVLFIQPIICLGEADSCANDQYEVLVRMKHEGELLSPGSFLPSADRLGLMSTIDRWVVSKTVETIAKNDKGQVKQRGNLFTINIAADTVLDNSFVAFVEALLYDKKVDPSLLCFEISESVALANFAETQKTLKQLSELGCSGSLDDFGSGFSSLNYLRELTLKYLKIDGSFIHNMSKNRIDAAMVEGVNKVGQVMNLHTIAELVENEITVKLLQKMGVDYAQGYHCGKPFPMSNIYSGNNNSPELAHDDASMATL